MGSSMQIRGDENSAVGWHVWTWEAAGRRLTSWRRTADDARDVEAWIPGRTHAAQCAFGHAHAVPDVACGCGIDVYLGPIINRDAVADDRVVVGLIAGGGRLVNGPWLRRCAEARLIAIGCYHRVPGCHCQEAALAYGVEFYPRPHRQMLVRAREEGWVGSSVPGLWRSYDEVMPVLQRVVSLEYKSQDGEPFPVPADVEVAAEAETAASDSIELKTHPVLTKEWWSAYTDYLLGNLTPYRQTEVATKSLLGMLNRFGVTSRGGDPGELESMVYLLTLTALAGQFNRHAGVLFEWLRECWRCDVSCAVESNGIGV